MFLLGKLGLKFLFNKVRRLRKNINIKMIKIIANPIITFVAQFKVGISPESLK